MIDVVIASGNKDKIKEISAILGRFNFNVVTKAEVGLQDVDPEENGETFEENSYTKAKAIMELCNLPCIADDSGLMVDYLDGAPGVHSGRFAGEDQNYRRNNEKLLALMDGVSEEKRGAKFVTVITMLFPDGREIVARGECPGRIITEFRGDQGFGYDPVFVPDGYSETFAELGPEVKNVIGHRAKAFEELERRLSYI